MSQTPELAAENKLTVWWISLPPLSKVLIIALAIPLLVLNVWAISTIFAYFRTLVVAVLVASLLAFLLNYPMAALQKRGLQRGQAATVVFLIALFAVLVLGVTVLPVAFTQAQQFISKLPDWFDSGKNQLLLLDEQLHLWNLPFRLDELIVQVNDRLKAELQTLAGEALNLTFDVAVFTAGKLLEILLTVILTFYLLQHGPEVWSGLVSWLPRRVQAPFSRTLRRSFKSYFIGQLIVATCLGATLTVVFLLLKIPFGLLFGLTIGLLALIPFGSGVGIFLVTFLVALRDIGIAAEILVVAVITQQLIDNIVAPRVLGSVTGLNPFWVFLSILAGARIGGLLGVITAVPTAVVLKTILSTLRQSQAVAAAVDSNPLPAGNGANDSEDVGTLAAENS
jgi:predicted PurR-regulated permease PerM